MQITDIPKFFAADNTGNPHCPKCGFLARFCDCPAPISVEDEPAPLRDYTEALQRLHDYEHDHSDVLVGLHSLESLLLKCEADLKEYAREHGPMANQWVRVTVNAAPRKRVWNADLLLNKLPWLIHVPGIISMSVDDKALTKQLKISNVPDAVVADALTITEGTPAVRVIEKAEVMA